MEKVPLKHRLNCLAIIFVLILVFSIFATVLSACDKKQTSVIVTYTYSTDGLLDNPDRGLRGEAYLFLKTNSSAYKSNDDAQAAFDKEVNRYPEDIKLVQQYVYITEYYKSDLDDTAFDNLKTHFEHIRECGVRILLRFAYEHHASEEGWGPTTEMIERHCVQLKEWIAENYDLFTDVVYSVQLGMIGLWGEGHDSVNSIETARVMAAVADMIPEPYTIMYRYYWMSKYVPKEIQHRFGIHEDWIVGQLHVYDLFGILSVLEPDCVEKTYSAAAHTLNDGEMPWADTWGYIEPIDFIKSAYNYSFTTLSAAHHYMESNPASVYNLQRYKTEYITEDLLQENGLPFFEPLFTDGKMTVFDYLQYHLGYLLTLDKVEQTGNSVSITLSNHGVASPSHFDLYYVKDGNSIKVDFDLSNLIHGHTVKIELGDIGSIDGIKIARDTNDSLTVKLANALRYENGINYLP